MDYHPDLKTQLTEESPHLQCVRLAVNFFQENFLYFGMAFLVPMFFAYGVHHAADALARSAAGGAGVRGSTLPIAKLAAVVAIRWCGWALAGAIDGFAAAGIVVAVRELRSGNERPTIERALEQPRAQLEVIAGSSILQFFGLILSIGVCFALPGYFLLTRGYSTSVFRWAGWTATALCLALFSRWMLSVPVLIEECCGVFASFRRSWELTADCMPVMVLFVAPAGLASYFAGKIPYYAFGLVARHFAVPAWSGWVPFVLSFVCVAWTEPLWAVGCAEAYYTVRERQRVKLTV
jgi:hypothetical protein